MPLYSVEQLQGRAIEEGPMLFAVAVGAANILRDIREHITNTFGGRMTRYEELTEAFQISCQQGHPDAVGGITVYATREGRAYANAMLRLRQVANDGADAACYAAKDAGRNAYRFFTADMNAKVQLRLQLETDMRRGLMDDEFFLVYQPQIEMQTGRACGVEALLRWRDPERGVISPSEFIPVAEESGMIQALGARVLRDACRQVVQWHRQNMPLRLAVNLSVQQLQHESWLAVVEDALASSGLAPRHLDLEITESVIITHPEKAVATLTRLKQMGVSITIDDFGTGYSSLSYLARLPIQGVKIDQRFVHGIEKNRNDEAITQAIIALSHSLGLRCIAEGVETRAQFNFLRTHGCEEAQGFLIAHPLTEDELRSWWRIQEELLQGRERQADLWQKR